MKDIVFLLDSGHGGMINGVYQTDPKIGKYFRFPDGEIAYEGVVNRQIKKLVLEKMTSKGIRAVDVCPSELDLSLDARCDYVNLLCREYGNTNCLLISLHSNAGQGTGFEIWTSPGQNKSDEYATKFFNLFATYFPTMALRQDKSDGDPDKESRFYILVNTKCPAILTEFLFYDNRKDWEVLKDPATHIRYANMICDFALNINLNS